MQTNPQKDRVIKTVCQRDCDDTCFVDATIFEGKVARAVGRVESLITQGFLCFRGAADPKIVPQTLGATSRFNSTKVRLTKA